MPSIFHRRRGSEQIEPPAPHSATIAAKRGSVDATHHETHSAQTNANGTGGGGTGKLKSLLRSGGGGQDGSGTNRLKNRLSISGGLFGGSKANLHDDPPRSPPPLTTAPTDASPRSPRSPASAALFNDSYSLAGTASPESARAAHGRRGSQSWQPNYPVAVADNEYADIPPDGHAPGLLPAISPIANGASENERRRSSADQDPALASWQPIQPDRRESAIAAPSSPKPSTGLDSQLNGDKKGDTGTASELQRRSSTESSEPLAPRASTSSAQEHNVPNGGVSVPESRMSTESTRPLNVPDAAFSSASSAMEPAPSMQSIDSARTNTTSSNLSTGGTRTPIDPKNIPAGLVMSASGKLRPDMPMRRTTLLASPPMPRPIQNLPTLQGWAGLNQASGGQYTPSWGQAATGAAGQRTPGWGELATPGGAGGGRTPSAVPRTPGPGFPWLSGMSTPKMERSASKTAMSDEELRKARRHMVSRADLQHDSEPISPARHASTTYDQAYARRRGGR